MVAMQIAIQNQILLKMHDENMTYILLCEVHVFNEITFT